MTAEQIDLVRKSLGAQWPFRRKLAELFYSRFFDLAPDTRRLFPNDMERQQLKLMDTIAAIVGTLDQREIFQSIISNTGRKHAEFGVQTSHFVAFGRRTDMGPATAIWSGVHCRDAAGMDGALRRDPGGNDARRKNAVTNRPAPTFLPTPPTHSRAKRVASTAMDARKRACAGNPRLRVPGERSETRDPETRSAATVSPSGERRAERNGARSGGPRTAVYLLALSTLNISKPSAGLRFSCTTAWTALIIAKGASDWKMLRPMSTPAAPCWTAL